MGSHVWVSMDKRKDNTLTKRKGSWESYSEKKAHGSYLAESLPGKKKDLSSSLGLCYHHRTGEFLLISQLFSTEVSGC